MKSGFFKKTTLHLWLIVVLGILVYSNTLDVPFHFDDQEAIVQNPIIRDLGLLSDSERAKCFLTYPTLKRRFMGVLSFALNYRVHGLDVTGYHIINLSIHILNGMLVYFLVVLTFLTPRLENSGMKRNSVHIALFSALLFIAHPIQTQAVTYIVQRYTSLAAMFFLASLVFYIKSRLTVNQKPGTRKNGNVYTFIFYFLSLAFAVLAMKTKEIAFTLPLLIALYEFSFFRAPFKRRCLYLVPFLITMPVIPLTLVGLDMPIENVLGEASVVHISRHDYLLTELRVLVTYLRLLVLPVNQNLDYDYNLYQSVMNPQVLLSFLFLLGIFGLGVYLHRDRRRDAALSLAAFGIFWFFITLSVESGLVPLHPIYEHRVYLPGVGMITALTVFAFFASYRWPGMRMPVTAALAVIVVVFASAAYSRNSIWQSGERLWEDVVRKSPENARGRNNLGLAYMSRGMTDKAIVQFRAALERDPGYEEAHINLGNIYMAKGLKDEAMGHYFKASKINPYNAVAYYNLGVLNVDKGNLDKAAEHFRAALKIRPDHVMAHNNLGSIHFERGEIDKAIKYYSSAIELDPGRPDTHFNLGLAYIRKGRVEDAVKEMRIVLRISPGHPEANRMLKSVAGKRL
jgi:tetratricopeptide (TPR) repeat protein